MDEKFSVLLALLPDRLEELLKMSPLTYERRPSKRAMPQSGVYLFSEGKKNLYVGRSNDLHGRYGRHCRQGATDRQASFAFKLAREKTGNMTAAYRTGDGSRKGLMGNEEFVMAFNAAKVRIRKMDYRCVEEQDQTRQALLEIYAATVLDTRYNDFDTY